MTLEQALFIAVSTLAGCVAFLFLWFKGQFALILAKLEDCETDREQLWERMLGIEEGKKDKTDRFTTPPIKPHKR